MALKALDIYKVLPKKNCKECGDPTCLTFAMKLAQGKADVDLCPYLDESARQVLGASTRPPIQRARVGVGERRVTCGEEFVFYRHEKTFYHQPGIMYLISDQWQEDRIVSVCREVKDMRFTRIGMDLRVDGVAIKNDSGSSETFAKAVSAVESAAHLPEVLIAGNPAALEAGLGVCGSFRPLIHAATPDNYEAVCALAKKFGSPVVVKAPSVDALGELTRSCVAAGADKLFLDLSRDTPGEFLRDSTLVRKLAISRVAPELGYPVYCDATGGGTQQTALIAMTAKFGSVIVVEPLSLPDRTAELVLRQNIFTDPQKPIQITPGLYRVGNPGRDAPVFITVNFSLTYFTLQGYLEATRVPCFLLIVDTEGLSVLTAVAAGKFNESLVRDWIAKTGLSSEVDHKTLIIPGYAAPLSGRIEESTGWKVLVGPRDAAEVGELLEKEWPANR